MQSNPRFIMIGGFLGAGKTTTVSRLASQFQSEGKNVIIVTNDQASDLVDTNILRSQGFNVGEVAGSCFCCNFNELTETVERLGEDQRPDVILAEPVGSCTDLVATVIRPLREIYSHPLKIAPYGVIVKPSHGARILSGKKKGGFSPQAEYIFRKQIEEADFVLINRIDELSTEQVGRLIIGHDDDVFSFRLELACQAGHGRRFTGAQKATNHDKTGVGLHVACSSAVGCDFGPPGHMSFLGGSFAANGKHSFGKRGFDCNLVVLGRIVQAGRIQHF